MIEYIPELNKNLGGRLLDIWYGRAKGLSTYTQSRYRQHWLNQTKTEKTPLPPAPLSKHICGFLGEPTGKTIQCSTCSGKVILKLMSCKIHGECTVGKKSPNIACCINCPDRTNPTPTQNTSTPIVNVTKWAEPYITPTSDKLVITIAIGKQSQAEFSYTGNRIEKYAEKCGADYIVITESSNQEWPMAEKWRVSDYIRQYKQTLYIDADVWITDNAPNIFEEYTSGIWMANDLNYLSPSLGWAEYELREICKSQEIPAPFKWDIMHNSGVFITGPEMATWYTPMEKPFPAFHCAEQFWQQVRLHEGKQQVNELDQKWNWEYIGPDFWKKIDQVYFIHLNGVRPVEFRIDLLKRFAVGNLEPMYPPVPKSTDSLEQRWRPSWFANKPKSLGESEMFHRWAYGVTTVPERRETLLPQTLKSLAAAGFDKPKLFVDGSKDPDSWEREFGLEVTVRYPKIRTHGNWVLSLYELYIRNIDCDRFAIFQDDFIVSKNLRKYLDRIEWPEKSYFNLYTFPSNQSICPKESDGTSKTGFYKSNQKGRGAVALAFSREAVQVLLHHEHMIERSLDVSRGHKAVDGGIVSAFTKAGWTEYVHNPSLVQHTGDISSMGNTPHLKALSFRGEDFDCLELLKNSVLAVT